VRRPGAGPAAGGALAAGSTAAPPPAWAWQRPCCASARAHDAAGA
jgi:hypothetical protein